MDFPNSSFYTPTESDLIKGAEEALRIKKYAQLKSYNVRVFDMSSKEDIDAYTTVMKEILEGVSSKTHFVWAKERTLVDGVWKIFLEWSVYTYTEQIEGNGKNE